MKIYLVGTGMEGRNTLTHEAENAVREADVLIGAERMVQPFKDFGKQIFCSYDAEKISEYLNKSEFECAAVLLSGDIGFYSGAKKLRNILSGHEIHTISGIASPVYFSAKIGIPWEDMKFISLHGAENNIVINVCQNKYCFFLLGGSVTAGDICRRLCEYNMQDIKVYIGENLAYPDEKIQFGKAGDFQDYKSCNLSVLVAENENYRKNLPYIIPESEFYHDIVKKHIPITKSEIRKFVVLSLEIKDNENCWEIGSGTGATTVEMAWQCPEGKVYTIDKQEEACTLTGINARKFGCDNIISFKGDAAELPDDFPIPDKIFVGGSSGSLDSVVSAALSKNPNVRIAITAVSLETIQNTMQVFSEYGISFNITQFSVTRTNKTGGYTMFNAQNPIFLIWGERK